MWRQKEKALKRRMSAMVDKLNTKAHTLEPLKVGDHVHVQNQYGNHPSRWDKTGVIVHAGDYDKYMVRVHGSRRVTARNRRFLRKFVPLGEKMTEQFNPLPLRPMPLSEEIVESRQQHPVLPSVKPAPDISPAPTETPQPAPTETPEPSQVPITDSFEKGPTDNQLPSIKDTGGKTYIPGPPLGEPVPRRSTREKKKTDFYGQWVERK